MAFGNSFNGGVSSGGGGGSDITASQITDASPNGRSLITAADYAAMRSLLSAQVQLSIVTKSVAESRTSTTTTTSDTELLFPADANSLYEFDFFFTVTGTVAAGGLRAGLALPASAEAIVAGRTTANNTQHTTSNNGVISSLISAAQMLATQDCWLTGRVKTLGTSGDVVLSWAQNTSSVSPVTIASGATVSYRKLR